MRRILSFHVPSSWPVFVALISWCLFFAAFLSACRQSLLEDWSSQTKSNLVACGVSTVRYPTNREGFDRLYQNRGFYKDGNHLGRDLALPEGTPIHPIACGTVRYFGPASGYGTLVVVIEHRLSEPRIVKNGLEEQVTVTSFLSIYGHMTMLKNDGTRLAIRVGDTVSPEDVIGYIENDARNGDGAEHLHFGIRLQTMSAAQATDQSWFRGYDTTPSQLRWFADPAGFLDVLMTQGIAVRSHPMGTVLTNQRETGLAWMVGEHDDLLQIDPFDMESEHLTSHCIPTSEEELACYAKGSAYQPELTASQLLKFDDASAVYEYQNRPSPVRYVFISQEAFNSWGWKNAQIVTKPASERPAFFARYQDKGFRRLRDGSLVKGRWASEVSVVSNGRRLPIFDWTTFLAMGYRAEQIIEVDPLTLDEVAFPRGPTITPETAAYCAYPKRCGNGSCDAGVGGGGIEADASVPSDLSVNVPDMKQVLKQPEICNGLDDDGNGSIDEIFLCPLGRHGPLCVTSCGVAGFRVCEAPACDWSLTCYTFSEVCDNAFDDDCDGKTDCADGDCLKNPLCAPKPDMGFAPPDMVSSPPDMSAFRDLVMPGLVDVAKPNLVERRLWIEAGANLKASCPQGLIIVIWDPQGKQVRSVPGAALDVPIGINWHGWVMTTTVCGNQYHGGWIPKGGSARDAGFASVRLDGKELVGNAQMVCADPYDGLFDFKIAVPLAGEDEGSCPR